MHTFYMDCAHVAVSLSSFLSGANKSLSVCACACVCMCVQSTGSSDSRTTGGGRTWLNTRHSGESQHRSKHNHRLQESTQSCTGKYHIYDPPRCVPFACIRQDSPARCCGGRCVRQHESVILQTHNAKGDQTLRTGAALRFMPLSSLPARLKLCMMNNSRAAPVIWCRWQ